MKNWATLEADINMILPVHYSPGRGGHGIEYIVLHHNGADLSIAGCYSVWCSREASAHYQVDSAGSIGQLVWDTDTAWHCGDFDANQRSIGIEHADCSSSPWAISEAALDNGAHLVAALCMHYGLGRPAWGVNVFGHSDFAPTECPASLAVGGSQHDEYMARAGYWYDQMSGNASGWIEDNGRWWYRHEDGSYPHNGWESIDGQWYLFDADGWMLTGWQQVGGKWYYLTESGAMATGWKQDGAKWYYLDPASGEMHAADVASIGGKWYAFGADGEMQYGVSSDASGALKV